MSSVHRYTEIGGRYTATFLAQLASPALFRRSWPIAYVLNPGSERDVAAYFPKLAHQWVRDRGLTFAGFLTGDRIFTSIIVAFPYTNEELLGQREVTELVVRQLERLHVQRFALNGVIPAAIGKHAVPLPDERYVVSQEGTLFMMENNVADVLAHPEHAALRSRPIAIVGAGYCGAQLAARLALQGQTVLAFDQRPEAAERLPAEVAFCGADMARIQEAGVIALLTTRGNDGMQSILPHLVSGQAVVSDTHPKVSSRLWEQARQKGVFGYECATTLPGFRLTPKLPRWPADTLPGCVVTALVEATTHRRDLDPAEFARQARAMGIVSRLDLPGPYRSRATPSSRAADRAAERAAWARIVRDLRPPSRPG